MSLLHISVRRVAGVAARRPNTAIALWLVLVIGCGVAGGRTLIEIEALWTLGPDYPEGWPRPRDGWTIQIEGEPSAQLHFVSLASFARRDVPIDEHIHAADIATAMHAVNAVPAMKAMKMPIA